jgi:hypothetical protein
VAPGGHQVPDGHTLGAVLLGEQKLPAGHPVGAEEQELVWVGVARGGGGKEYSADSVHAAQHVNH